MSIKKGAYKRRHFYAKNYNSSVQMFIVPTTLSQKKASATFFIKYLLLKWDHCDTFTTRAEYFTKFYLNEKCW